MKTRRLLTLLCLIPLSVGAQPTESYSHGDPTAGEQMMLELINRARANPEAEGLRLVQSTDPAVVNAIQQFSVNTDQVVADFQAFATTPPLAFHPALIEAARDHSQAQIDNDLQTHQIPGGPNLRERTVAAGYTPASALRENVYAFVDNPWMGHAAFQIDWGHGPGGVQDPPGHRLAIMDGTNPDHPFTEIGIGLVEVPPAPGRDVTGPLIVTQDFGRPSNPVHYLVGVVYEDRDGDGFYSEGEGLEGITVTPDQGTFFAVTSSSGGYAIPLQEVSGTVTVTASGPGLGNDRTQAFSFQNESVKMDFIAPATSDPDPDPVVQNPLLDFGAGTTSSGGIIETTWFGAFTDLAPTSGFSPGSLLHNVHGFIFYVGNHQGMWFWSPSLGWSFTTREFFPFLYVADLESWVYYFDQGSQPRFFYHFANGRFFFNDPELSDELTFL